MEPEIQRLPKNDQVYLKDNKHNFDKRKKIIVEIRSSMDGVNVRFNTAEQKGSVLKLQCSEVCLKKYLDHIYRHRNGNSEREVES